MDSKLGTFLMGVIAAVVLALLWKKDGGCGCGSRVFQMPGASDGIQPPGMLDGCCGIGGPGPAYAASPVAQGAGAGFGTEGMISPGTPPLNAITGGGGLTSFYTSAGVTPDNSFTFIPIASNPSAVGTPAQPPTPASVPGSATTPAAITPTRATQAVPTYYETGFVQRYNVTGVYIH
jgi:hypothetical protein